MCELTLSHLHTHTKRGGGVAGCCSVLINYLMSVLALIAVHGLSLGVGRGLLFAVEQVLHRRGLSCCGAPALGTWACGPRA